MYYEKESHIKLCKSTKLFEDIQRNNFKRFYSILITNAFYRTERRVTLRYYFCILIYFCIILQLTGFTTYISLSLSLLFISFYKIFYYPISLGRRFYQIIRKYIFSSITISRSHTRVNFQGILSNILLRDSFPDIGESVSDIERILRINELYLRKIASLVQHNSNRYFSKSNFETIRISNRMANFYNTCVERQLKIFCKNLKAGRGGK